MADKSDQRLEIEEKLMGLFSNTHRIAYTTSEIMNNMGIDADRGTYIEILRDHDRIYELERKSVKLWILPRMRAYQTLEQRVSDLENEHRKQ